MKVTLRLGFVLVPAALLAISPPPGREPFLKSAPNPQNTADHVPTDAAMVGTWRLHSIIEPPTSEGRSVQWMGVNPRGIVSNNRRHAGLSSGPHRRTVAHHSMDSRALERKVVLAPPWRSRPS